MFRDELDELESRYADRLRDHPRPSATAPRPELRGRIDREKLERGWLSGLAPDDVDEWFLCGPIELVDARPATR